MGRWGLGLFANILAGYRFLALNYDPGDEIYVFGFSRGAYTARSLVGMVGRVGLLTREAVVADQLGPAEERYRDRRQAAAGDPGAVPREVLPPRHPRSRCSASSTPSARWACRGR